MSEIDFATVTPQKLTVAQLKRGITHFGGKIGNMRLKAEYVTEFLRAREAYEQARDKSPSLNLNEVTEDVKTINLRLSKKPEDLTLKAFDITGMMPRVKNSDIQRDLAREQDAGEVSPQRRLKANIDIEKTPQSIVQQKNVALEDFMMKSVY